MAEAVLDERQFLALARRLLALSDDDEVRSSEIVAHRMLGGGYSGAAVALVWLSSGPPLVIKAGRTSEMKAEAASRSLMAESNDVLVRLGLEVVSPSVEVEEAGRIVEWSALAYPYLGGATYDELATTHEFDGYLRLYVEPDDDRVVSREALDLCFRQVLDLLLAQPSDELRSSTPYPLAHYIPEPPWGRGARAMHAAASSVFADQARTPIDDIESWWADRLTQVKIAPFHDARVLHGDARFANILVNRMTSSVAMIDFGNSKVGHCFADLARFEIDLVLRGAQGAESVRESLIREAWSELVTSPLLTGPEPDGRYERALRLWRASVAEVFPIASRPGSFLCYRWFLLGELLTRLTWVRADLGRSAGANFPLLFEMIEATRASLDSTHEEASTSSSIANLSGALQCRRAYVPRSGVEREVNRLRNVAKRRSLGAAAASGAQVRLIAETGNSYLNPRGPFFEDCEALLEGGGSLRVVLANIYCIEGLAISSAYRGQLASAGVRNTDVERKFLESVDGYRALARRHGDHIEVRTSDFGIGATVLATPSATFFEPYLRADRRRRQELLFDSFELELAGRDGSFARFLTEHFDFLFTNAVPLTEVDALQKRYVPVVDAWRSASAETGPT